MKRLKIFGSLCLFTWIGLLSATADDSPRPEKSRLRSHVETLASADFGGRRGPGARKAAEYIERRFRDLKLEPLFDGDYLQAVPGERPGQNVGAKLVGSDPKLKEEYVIVSAHYDHLGRRGSILYPGADDNASGVAMLLEAARSFAGRAEPPKRSVVFIGFDLEEDGLFGSRYFVAHPPFELKKVKLFITADMIGRSLGGCCKDYVFVMGSESAPEVRPWIADGRRRADEALKVGLLGADFLVIDRSDYGPFQKRRIPYLFFSTGENPCYHRPEDVPETIEYDKLTSIARLIFHVANEAANSSKTPVWNDSPTYDDGEPTVIRDIVSQMLDHRKELNIGPGKAALMRRVIKGLDEVIAKGTITPDERALMLRASQYLMFTVL